MEGEDLWLWLSRRAWPLWLERGIDWRARAFHESLTLDDHACTATFRRLRVAARQVYSFALARRHGLPRADEAVELGLDFLRRTAAHPDGGYAWRFALDGRVIDSRRDLYDHAFVLLALAAASRVAPPEPLRREALALDDFIEQRLAHASGGYLESLPPALPRRQNPHMHLLEARLAAAEAFGEVRFLRGAEALLNLFLARFLPDGCLAEFYDDDLRPLESPHRAEPGHHSEWLWLLDWQARLSGRPAPAGAVAALRRFLAAHGRDPATGALRDAVWSDGRVIAGGARLWPQTERLKSAALGGDPAEQAEARRVLATYLRPDGLWHERRLAEGGMSPEPAPASSLYHLSCGIAFIAQPDGDARP